MAVSRKNRGSLKKISHKKLIQSLSRVIANGMQRSPFIAIFVSQFYCGRVRQKFEITQLLLEFLNLLAPELFF